MAARPRTAVVHLVRHANGRAPFDAFMDSYERHGAGAGHDLVLLLKGFPDAAAAAPYRERAAAHAPRAIEVGDEGFDLTVYLEAAARLPHERVCFLNSFSEVLAGGWLGLLGAAMDADARIGAAGATGSWGSQLGYGLWQMGLAGGYDDVFDDRRAARVAMHALEGAPPPRDVRHWVYNAALTAWGLGSTSLFPSIHLRTNAFLVDRALLLALGAGRARTKRATYRLESGRDSLTSRMRARGRPPVVVDRHGVARRAEAWPQADVFWQGDQRDLLVADNQTRKYAAATPEHRDVLSRYAWGLQARPAAGP